MIAHAFGWSYESIFNLPTDRAFAFCFWVQERERADQIFALSVSDFPWLNRKAREEIRKRVVESGGGRIKKAAYDYATDDEEMLCMIGDALAVGGDDWARTHPRRMAWLAKNGYTASDAISACKKFTDERLSIIERPREYTGISSSKKTGEVTIKMFEQANESDYVNDDQFHSRNNGS